MCMIGRFEKMVKIPKKRAKKGWRIFKNEHDSLFREWKWKRPGQWTIANRAPSAWRPALGCVELPPHGCIPYIPRYGKCGLWIFSTKKAAEREFYLIFRGGYNEAGIRGRIRAVRYWGTVAIHQHGVRAEVAMIIPRKKRKK